MLDDLAVGDEVVTAGGIYGELTQVGEDDVLVRIAPDLEVRVARRAIAGVTRDPEDEDADETDEPEEPLVDDQGVGGDTSNQEIRG
jgi:preprotein translocase subunit YajC